MGFVSLGKTNNRNNLSLKGKSKFGEDLKFGTKSTPLKFNKMSEKEILIFREKLKKKNKKLAMQKTIIFLTIISLFAALYIFLT